MDTYNDIKEKKVRFPDPNTQDKRPRKNEPGATYGTEFSNTPESLPQEENNRTINNSAPITNQDEQRTITNAGSGASGEDEIEGGLRSYRFNPYRTNKGNFRDNRNTPEME